MLADHGDTVPLENCTRLVGDWKAPVRHDVVVARNCRRNIASKAGRYIGKKSPVTNSIFDYFFPREDFVHSKRRYNPPFHATIIAVAACV